MQADFTCETRFGAPLQSSGIVERDDASISWTARGDGTPAIIITGFAGSSRTAHRVWPHIATQHRVFLFDNRGTGDSECHAGNWTLEDMARDVLAVMDVNELDSAHILSASMGGMVAQHLALLAPHRVRSLVLGCTTAYGQIRSMASWRFAARALARPLLGDERSFDLAAPVFFSDRTLTECRERALEELRIQQRDKTPLNTVMRQIRAMSRHDTRARLAELKMPVLVLHGKDDRVIPVCSGTDLASRIENSRLVLLDDCGHAAFTDNEFDAAAAILEFLSDADLGVAYRTAPVTQWAPECRDRDARQSLPGTFAPVLRPARVATA